MNNGTNENNSITVQWRNKSIARKNLTFMRNALKGEFNSLIKNTAKHVKGTDGQVCFNLIGLESAKAINVLLGMTGGKVLETA